MCLLSKQISVVQKEKENHALSINRSVYVLTGIFRITCHHSASNNYCIMCRRRCFELCIFWTRAQANHKHGDFRAQANESQRSPSKREVEDILSFTLSKRP
jgi:hypothetical protein